MTEQGVFKFVSENWSMVLWLCTTAGTVFGMVVYNVKVVLPGYSKRVRTMEKDIEKLTAGADKFVTTTDCANLQNGCHEHSRKEHEEIKKTTKEILNCIKAESKLRIRAKIHNLAFMSAVKEKLDLSFEVPMNDA